MRNNLVGDDLQLSPVHLLNLGFIKIEISSIPPSGFFRPIKQLSSADDLIVRRSGGCHSYKGRTLQYTLAGRTKFRRKLRREAFNSLPRFSADNRRSSRDCDSPVFQKLLAGKRLELLVRAILLRKLLNELHSRKVGNEPPDAQHVFLVSVQSVDVPHHSDTQPLRASEIRGHRCRFSSVCNGRLYPNSQIWRVAGSIYSGPWPMLSR